MKMRWLWCGVALILTTMLGISGIYPQKKEAAKEPKKQVATKQEAGRNPEEMLAAYLKYAELSEHHKRLKPLEGTWDTTVKAWMAPGAPPDVSKGTSKNRLILGGRFLHQDYKGQFMSKPFEGVGITGYDNFKKKYTGVWADSMSTAIMYSLGTCDESGKVLTFVGEFDDPVEGKTKKERSVIRIVDNNQHTMEMYESGPDGKEFKVMEITYRRK